MKPAWRIALCLGLLSLAPGLAEAGDRTEVIQFKPGAQALSKKAAIRGYDGAQYLLRAQAGQVMQVLFSPSNGSCYFNVTPPGSDTAMFNGSVSGNEFSANLTQTGVYNVQVYLMRSAARRKEACKYEIAFEISGTGAPAAHQRMPDKDEQACLQAVSQETNNGDVILLSRETSEASNTVIIGVGPQRAQWRCLVKNGKVSEVMSLTDEGQL